MIELLTAIGQAIGTFVMFIINTLASVVWTIISIAQFAGTIGSLFAYCPTFLLAFLEISLALTILFAIIKLL